MAAAPPPAPAEDLLALYSSPSPCVPVPPPSPPISLVNNNGETSNLLLDEPIREQKKLYGGVGRATNSVSDGRDMQLSDQDNAVDDGEPQMHKDGGSGKRQQQCKNLVAEQKRSKKLNHSSLAQNITKTCMMETAESRPWSDLLPELLGLVLMRLPSLADRVRLRAVCHPWRSNSMFQSLPLPFPWLALPDGAFLSIPNGEIHRISVPEGACCHGSVDNWLFLMHNDDMCSFMNPFSKTSLELPKLAEVWKRALPFKTALNPVFYKLFVPSPLDSSPCSLVAAMIIDEGTYPTLCICQPPIEDAYRDDKFPAWMLGDIAFFGGKLYVLGGFDGLCVIDKEIGISSIECIIYPLGDFVGMPQSLPSEEAYIIREYLVECGSRLLMVKRYIRSMAPSTRDDFYKLRRTAALLVFEADLHTSPARWRRVTELGGHALFLGQHSSKALPASECSGYLEDCIYFMCDYPWPTWSANPLHDSGVYNISDDTITPLMSGSTEVAPRHGGQWRPTWFFPPEAV